MFFPLRIETEMNFITSMNHLRLTAGINSAYNQLKTPAPEAILNGNSKISKELIEGGVDSNKKNNSENTPLHLKNGVALTSQQ